MAARCAHTKLPNGIRIGGWEITADKGHILGETDPEYAEWCPYPTGLPALPEETYARNALRLRRLDSGAACAFTAFDALARVNPTEDLVKVACAAEWAEARAEHADALQPAAQYDWTFTTDYAGTLDDRWTAEPTTERIDIESLKVREPILFYDSLHLYGDDFDDNGAVGLSVRVRVMPSGFFVLMRLILRVDGVLLRAHDTRLHHKFAEAHITREYTQREISMAGLEELIGIKLAEDRAATAALYREETLAELLPRLPVTVERVERLTC